MIKDKIFKALFEDVVTISDRYLKLTLKFNVNIKMCKSFWGDEYRSIDLNVVVLQMRRVSNDWVSTYDIKDLGRVSKTDAMDARCLIETYLNNSIAPLLNTSFHRKYYTRLSCGSQIGINKITYKRK